MAKVIRNGLSPNKPQNCWMASRRRKLASRFAQRKDALEGRCGSFIMLEAISSSDAMER